MFPSLSACINISLRFSCVYLYVSTLATRYDMNACIRCKNGCAMVTFLNTTVAF